MPAFRAAMSKQVRGPSSRSKLACVQCRKSHVKCDQSRPCSLCKRRGFPCSFEEGSLFTALEFKAPTNGHLQSISFPEIRSGPATFVNETDDISDQYYVLSPESEVSSIVASAQHTTPWQTQNDPAAPITDPTDAFFLWRYVDYIGPRFDMFDDSPRHFSTVVPQLALTDSLVLLACLAVAARQYSLVNDHRQRQEHEHALAYYNEAIHLLSKRLQDSSPNPGVFASCLLIAHCEMVESKATDWGLHLKGTGDLLKMHGWHGMSGGLAQASFWIYCRMIILASLSSGVPPALDPAKWIPRGSFPEPDTWTLELWQKKVVMLLGMVHNFWARTRNDVSGRFLRERETQWAELQAQLLRHQENAPPICSPLSILPPDGDERPFRSVRYMNGPVSAAWQMLHTAFLICTICQPCEPSLPSFRLEFLSTPRVSHQAQSYASQIVSNSLTNQCPIAWANAVQLLTVAGQCLVAEPERRACVHVLGDIQRQTGWNTRANVERLVAAWDGRWKHDAADDHSAESRGTTTDAGRLLYQVWLGDERKPD